ncbi:MAG: glycerophosphodiester phosphodiesterase [Bacteroidetes bacterium]|nr:glycerophosphodiester phosphodiesterase [Bacteroidota bacterium]
MIRASNIIFVILIAFCSCRKEYHAIIPDTNWNLFNSPDAIDLAPQTRTSMEGVYLVEDGDGANVFGKTVAIKWSYEITGVDTSYHLSLFSGTDIAYFIMEGKRLGDSLLFNGYWRKLVNTETGIIRFTISAIHGASELLKPAPVIVPGTITMNGVFGNGDAAPQRILNMSYLRPLYHGPTPFQILAHRAGGRTSDLLPVSENSIGMVLLASQLGATGIEIDAQLTKDSVVVIYHDNQLNLRLIQKDGLVGNITDYTYDQLYSFVRLIDGERIPTLREMLDAVVYRTQLKFVWIDSKRENSVEAERALQQEYLQKAAAAGRDLQIVIGIPSNEVFDKFKTLPNYQNIPSLCELDIDDVESGNSQYWAPRFTLGLQNDLVDQVHGLNKKAFVWTLDVPDYINQFIRDGHFDGILSNYASSVAYYYYVQE